MHPNKNRCITFWGGWKFRGLGTNAMTLRHTYLWIFSYSRYTTFALTHTVFRCTRRTQCWLVLIVFFLLLNFMNISNCCVSSKFPVLNLRWASSTNFTKLSHLSQTLLKSSSTDTKLLKCLWTAPSKKKYLLGSKNSNLENISSWGPSIKILWMLVKMENEA